MVRIKYKTKPVFKRGDVLEVKEGRTVVVHKEIKKPTGWEYSPYELEQGDTILLLGTDRGEKYFKEFLPGTELERCSFIIQGFISPWESKYMPYNFKKIGRSKCKR